MPRKKKAAKTSAPARVRKFNGSGSTIYEITNGDPDYLEWHDNDFEGIASGIDAWIADLTQAGGEIEHAVRHLRRLRVLQYAPLSVLDSGWPKVGFDVVRDLPRMGSFGGGYSTGGDCPGLGWSHEEVGILDSQYERTLKIGNRIVEALETAYEEQCECNDLFKKVASLCDSDAATADSATSTAESILSSVPPTATVWSGPRWIEAMPVAPAPDTPEWSAGHALIDAARLARGRGGQVKSSDIRDAKAMLRRAAAPCGQSEPTGLPKGETEAPTRRSTLEAH
jgi:hypothetical protein